VVDASGKLKLEKQIPTTSGISIGMSLMVAPDSSLVFIGHEDFNASKLIRVGVTGEITAQKRLAGVFQLIRPVVVDGNLQLFGYDDYQSTSILLDARLEEVRREQIKHRSDFFANLAYRMPDQSLVLFGRAVHSIGEQYASGIAHVDPTLQTAKKLELLRAPFYDYGSIDAAVPTGNDGEFVTARRLLKHIPGNEVSNEARVGVALDFIQIQ
jgi:hypothetical protein